MNTELVESPQNKPVTIVGESATVLSIIQHAATNPEVDIDKMERLMAMHERIQARQAETAYSEALAAMQIELPEITERGGIKNSSGRVQSTYALWEDINEAIKPILSKHGFALSFRTDCSAGVKVTGVLSHKAGHKEMTEMLLPADTSGSKNSVQAIASSVSYGKRYTAGALLNLTSRGEDDDGTAAGKKEKPEPAKPKLSEKRLKDGIRAIKDGVYTLKQLKTEHDLDKDQLTILDKEFPQ